MARIKGFQHSKETRDKIGKANKGLNLSEKRLSWKGVKAGYHSLHAWIWLRKGKATICEDCGKTDKEGRIEWSNIDHTYQRKEEDYTQRCIRCHRKHDKINQVPRFNAIKV